MQVLAPPPGAATGTSLAHHFMLSETRLAELGSPSALYGCLAYAVLHIVAWAVVTQTPGVALPPYSLHPDVKHALLISVTVFSSTMVLLAVHSATRQKTRGQQAPLAVAAAMCAIGLVTHISLLHNWLPPVRDVGGGLFFVQRWIDWAITIPLQTLNLAALSPDPIPDREVHRMWLQAAVVVLGIVSNVDLGLPRTFSSIMIICNTIGFLYSFGIFVGWIKCYLFVLQCEAHQAQLEEADAAAAVGAAEPPHDHNRDHDHSRARQHLQMSDSGADSGSSASLRALAAAPPVHAQHLAASAAHVRRSLYSGDMPPDQEPGPSDSVAADPSESHLRSPNPDALQTLEERSPEPAQPVETDLPNNAAHGDHDNADGSDGEAQGASGGDAASSTRPGDESPRSDHSSNEVTPRTTRVVDRHLSWVRSRSEDERHVNATDGGALSTFRTHNEALDTFRTWLTPSHQGGLLSVWLQGSTTASDERAFDTYDVTKTMDDRSNARMVIRVRAILSALYLGIYLALVIAYFLSVTGVLTAAGSQIAFIVGELAIKVLYTMVLEARHTEMMHPAQTLKHLLAIEQAETSKRSAFVRYIFHEIRVPLQSISLAAEAIGDECTCGHLVQILPLLNGSINMMGDILNDVLMYQKLEDNKLTLEIAPNNIAECVDFVVHNFSLPARSKGLSLVAHVDPDVPLLSMFDAVRLKQVLANYVSNAIKFSKAGRSRPGITIAVQVMDARDTSWLSSFRWYITQDTAQETAALGPLPGTDAQRARARAHAQLQLHAQQEPRSSQQLSLSSSSQAQEEQIPVPRRVGGRALAPLAIDVDPPEPSVSTRLMWQERIVDSSTLRQAWRESTDPPSSCHSSKSGTDEGAPAERKTEDRGEGEGGNSSGNSGGSAGLPCDLQSTHMRDRQLRDRRQNRWWSVPHLFGGGGSEHTPDMRMLAGVDEGDEDASSDAEDADIARDLEAGQNAPPGHGRGGDRGAIVLQPMNGNQGEQQPLPTPAGASEASSFRTPSAENDTNSLSQPLSRGSTETTGLPSHTARSGRKRARRSKRLLITVTDCSDGISEADLGLLFRPFSQIRPHLVQGGRGSGLGLAISKQLIAMHGGNVGVTSTMGEGSTFAVVLPILYPRRRQELAYLHTQVMTQQRSGQQQQQQQQPQQQHDDGAHSDDRAYCSPSTVGGDDASDYADNSAAPDTAEGSAAASVAGDTDDSGSNRSSGHRDRYFGVKHDTRFPRVAGAATHSSTVHDLPSAKKVGDTACADTASPAKREADGGDSFAWVTTMVVDDVPGNRTLLARVLARRFGLTIVNADCENGQEALDYVRARDGTEDAIKLVMLDNVMPVMDGMTCASRLRELSSPPVVVGMTGNAMDGDIDAYKAAGAHAVFSKPLDIAEFGRYLAATFRRRTEHKSAEVVVADKEINTADLCGAEELL